jgi:phenylpropionate dioxygenase-like ring-hydroxylating dioxygenase large terminal subunit
VNTRSSSVIGEELARVALRQRSGHTLEQAFYKDEQVFENDMARVVAPLWLLVDHVSRLAKAGDWFLFEVGRESLIIVRDGAGQIHALFNVCRHRGSRVCLEREGHASAFVCPYHAWTYALDGRLRGARLAPPDFDKTRLGLHKAHCRVYSGFIFVSLAQQPIEFDDAYAEFARFLTPHGFDRATVAARRSYPTRANWKLVVENFLECYHCAPAHPEYCSVHPADLLLAYGAGHGSGPAESEQKYASKMLEWEKRVQALGHVTGMVEADPASPSLQTIERLPIGGDRLTESPDGKPIAPLMGELRDYDGGETACSFNPLSFVLASCDVAIVFRFTPRTPLDTDVEVLWLVEGSAVPDKDYDVERLIWLWDTTVRQDKKITENNQVGVLSSRYEPGPYMSHEAATARFVRWYLSRLQA